MAGSGDDSMELAQHRMQERRQLQQEQMLKAAAEKVVDIAGESIKLSQVDAYASDAMISHTISPNASDGRLMVPELKQF